MVEEPTISGVIAAPTEPPVNEPYTYVEQMPQFRDGGQEGIRRFIERNRKLPLPPADEEGKVFVTFVVTAAGPLRDIKILKGLGPALNAEALRVTRLLDGRFEPGKQNGKLVDVRYTIVVPFIQP